MGLGGECRRQVRQEGCGGGSSGDKGTKGVSHAWVLYTT